MKLLVIDVGNTSTAVGLWTDGRVSHVGHYDEGVVDLESLGERERKEGKRKKEEGKRKKEEGSGKTCGRLDFGSLNGIAYVSVVPKKDARWRRSARKFGLPFHQLSCRDFTAVGSRAEPGQRKKDSGQRAACGSSRTSRSSRLIPRPSSLTISYPRPETIGADRLADAAGAVSRYGAPVLVMDFGTALTAAVITKDRVWRGGVIAPGFPLMRDYLFERTAKLPRMELGRGRAPRIGRSTEEAMRFGALVGYHGMVREIVTTLRRNFREDFKLVATGGFARWALKDLDLPFVIDPTLTLYGAGLTCATTMRHGSRLPSGRRRLASAWTE